MPIFTDPIFDRTATDVANRTAKAFINVVDWLRIYDNAEIINLLINTLFDVNVEFGFVSDPTITTIPTVAELNTLLANIERIRIASGLPEILGLSEVVYDWQEGSRVDSPDYMDVNQWEEVLYIIRNNLYLSVEYMIYCGVAATGQPRFYQNRWRRFTWVENSVAPVRRAKTNVAITGTGLKRQNGYRRYD